MTDLETRPPGLADPDPAAVRAGRYVVDPTHTRILFGISHFGLSTFYGELPLATGALQLDPADPRTAALDISVAIAGISTSNATLDEELRSADWLDAERFPTARFTALKVEPDVPGRGRVAGELTLHGVTRPLLLDVAFVGGGLNPVKELYTIGFDGRGRFRRSDFGVTSHLPLIGDTIELILSGAFELEAQ